MARMKRIGPIAAMAKWMTPPPNGVVVRKPLSNVPNTAIDKHSFISDSENFTVFSKHWFHELNLYGATNQQTEAMFKRLRERFVNGPESNETSYQVAFTTLLGELVEEFLPGRELISPSFRVHEVTFKGTGAVQTATIKDAIAYALKTGAPVTFHYRSKRRSWNGSVEVQRRVRRMNIRSVSEDWFRAEHARGIRSFSFDEVSSATVEGNNPLTVGPEPMIGFVLTPSGMDNNSLQLFAGELGQVVLPGSKFVPRESMIRERGPLAVIGPTGEVIDHLNGTYSTKNAR